MGHDTASAIVHVRSGRQGLPQTGLRSVLLALLSKEPNTGYGIGRLLRNQLHHVWDARLQQIYSELAKLEAQGLVSVECIDLPNRPAKKVYSLTPAGELALDGWLLQRPILVACKDDLPVRLYCLERIPSGVIIRRLQERHDDYESEAEGLRRQLAQMSRGDPAQLGQLLALEAALARAEGQVSWCGKALSYVHELVEESSRPELRPDGRRAGRALRAAGV